MQPAELPPLSELIPLSIAPDRHLPRTRSGKKIDTAVVYRWARDGKNGVKLETVRINGTLYTHPKWLAEFIAAIN